MSIKNSKIFGSLRKGVNFCVKLGGVKSITFLRIFRGELCKKYTIFCVNNEASNGNFNIKKVEFLFSGIASVILNNFRL